MGKKHELTQMDIDASNAIKAGMSYGKYMALKKPTNEPAPKRKSRVEYKHTCQKCGKEFVTYTRQPRKFCSDYCKAGTYYKAVKPTHKVCPVCGKEFMASHKLVRYCSKDCARLATNQRMRAYNAKRRAMEAKCNG